MNTNAKILIGATIGAGIGYFIGSVIAEMVAIKDWESANADEIDDWVAGTENDPVEVDESLPENTHFIREKDGKVKKVVRNYSEMFANRPDIAKLAAKYNGDQEVPIPENDGMQMALISEDEWETPEEQNDKPITIISMSEFANADEGFESVTLNYYDDDVVTDEHDNPISHPEQILGEDALASFGVMSQDEDVVYVKNLSRRAMYEVVRTNKNYAVQKQRRARKAAVVRQLTKEEDDGEDNT